MRTKTIRCPSTGTRRTRQAVVDSRSLATETSVKTINKDVVVIGNGPSAITLSYLLSGRWPYYKGMDALGHPPDFLHARLESKPNCSLVLQDLKELSEGLEGRSSNPIALLYDTLNHPDADTGQDLPSLLSWKNHPEHAIDHVVLGRGPPGGSWQAMEGDVLTISRGTWMELANLSFREWEETACERQLGIRQKRASVKHVAQYYHDYVNIKGLRPYFRDSAEVTSVRRLDQVKNVPAESYAPTLWQVTGHVRTAEGLENFQYVTPNVVLAIGGTDRPNSMNVAGENLPFVIKSLQAMEKLISSQQLNRQSEPVLIVGAGLSAADAIIAAHFHGIPIIHVFRRKATDPSLIFGQLPSNMYPEYHKVYQMMKDNGMTYTGYTPMEQCQIVRIQSDGKVCLQGPDYSTKIKVSFVVVLIGSRPSLNFLENKGRDLTVDVTKPISCRNNPLDVDLFTLESTKQPGIYAMGPLVSDNFVRFAQGGALAITRDIHTKLSRLKAKEEIFNSAIPSVTAESVSYLDCPT